MALHPMVDGEQPHRHSHSPSVTDTLTPKVRLPKKLIVCCDGTWLDSDNGWVKGKWGKEGHPAIPSNVTRISRAIASEDDDHHPQIVYYQAGVGTGIGLYSQLMGGGTGLGLAENIREAYSFLASNYSEHEKLAADHDSIFLIGFSRGAFTARSLGGFIGAVGILKKDAMAHFYEIFTDWENAGSSNYTPTFFDSYFSHPEEYMPEKVKPDSKLASDPSRINEYMDEYRRLLLDLSLTQEANVKIIGVWDTVGALGIPVNPLLQRLLPFLPAFVREYSWFDTALDNHIEHAFQALALDERRFPYSPAIWEKPAGNTTNLKQCWFAGAHSNIGGSYEDTGMADITLAWMMDQLAGHSTYPSDRELCPDFLPFRPLDWIKFDHPYISHLYHQQTKYYAHHGGGSRGWGMGRVYDSLTLPQSLVGAKTRVPGRYHRTFYHSGKIDPKRPLHNTNEYIHASVRARLDFGGNGYEPQDGLLSKVSWFWHRLTSHAVGAYKPQRPGGPLDGWVVQDGREYHDCPNDRVVDLSSEPPERAEGVKWVYSGKHAVQNSVMFEDRLGDFEKLLLQEEPLPGGPPVVGNGWLGFRGMLELMGRKAQTF
ncbi:hypothetical protein MBLNU230_g8285t1 [Neophaeotheca triangularis]